MFLSDYHVHTNISPDSGADILDMCRAAIDNGLAEVAFTDHLECGEICMGWQNGKKPFDLDKYIADLDRARAFCGDRLVVKNGIEIGQWLQDPVRAKWIFTAMPLDFVICSLHSPNGFNDMYWVDYMADNIKDVIYAYAKECADMAEADLDFDTFGHLTLPFRYASRFRTDLNYEHCMDEIDRCLKALAEGGRALEVNTSGLRCPLGVMMPDLPFLKRFKEFGGKYITIGTDAHKPEHVGADVAAAQALIKSAGFDEFVTFDKRSMIHHAI